MSTPEQRDARRARRSTAMRFVLLIGVVSLFADMTHEGARSVTGPFLATLGASALIVSVVAGFGELLGYALRFVFGYRDWSLDDPAGQPLQVVRRIRDEIEGWIVKLVDELLAIGHPA